MARLVDRLLHPVQLSASGRPILLQQEVECQLIENTSIEFEGPNGTVVESESLRTGLLFLSTHRLIWVDEVDPVAGKGSYAVPFGAIADYSLLRKTLSRMFASPRLRLGVFVTPEKRLDVRRQPGDSSRPTANILIVFRGSTPNEPFLQRFQETFHSRAWEADLPSSNVVGGPGAAQGSSRALTGPDSVPSPRFNPSMAGVGGILRKEQEQLEAVDKSLQDAFSDLNALMAKAKDMVQLAERMRAKIVAPPPAGEDDFGGSQEEMQDWLLSVGIASPVTKESAGAHYHQQLSRQLADFVMLPLEKAGGMLAVVDAYCMFNRARGTELISPEDLLQACKIWPTIKVPMRLRRFDSGVSVIQSNNRSDDEIVALLGKLAAKQDPRGQGLSASEAAQKLNLAPSLAKEELLTAEARGVLCRDDSADGLRFYNNFFLDV